MKTRMMELFDLEVQEESFYDESIHIMYMPESWRDYLVHPEYKLKYQVKPLGQKLNSIFPEMIHVAVDYMSLANDWPWIVSTEKLSTSLIKKLTLGWLASLKKCTVSDLPAELKEVELSWHTTTFGDFYAASDKKTVDKYQWLPGLAAIKFCAEPRQVDLGHGIVREFQFFHTVFNHKHECITSPYQKSARHDPFSYVLKISLENRGGDANKLLLSVSVGIRRYLKEAKIKTEQSGRVCYLKDNPACSVLVSVRNPDYIQDAMSFSQLQFERYVDSGKGTFSRWKTHLDNLYWDVLYGESFEPDLFMSAPASYLEGKGDITAWVVNHNSFRNVNSWVKPGLGVSEKRGLFSSFKETLAKYELEPLPHIIELSGPKMNDQRFPIISEKDRAIRIEVYSSEEMFAAMKQLYTTPQKSIDMVGKKEEGTVIFRPISEQTYRLDSNKEVVVEFVHCNPDGIVQELEIGSCTADVAYHSLVAQIKSRLAQQRVDPTVKKLALIEINGKEDWSNGADPKFAIRDAMKQSGRLTQFIEPLGTEGLKADKPRIINALLDLLNDAGFLSFNVTKLEETRPILSFNLLKADHGFLPVASKMNRAEVMIKMLGVDQWVPVEEAPFYLEDVKLLKQQPNKFNNSSAVFGSFLTQVIEDELDRHKHEIIVMIHAKLRKGWLPAIQNGRIQYDVVPFLNERLMSESRVKFIRINTMQDVPQYRIFYTENEERPTKSSGVFKDPLGIYYGVGGRPVTMRGAFVRDIKYLQPSKLMLQQRAVECIPLGPLDEVERDDLANLVDQLRRVGLTYDKHTVDPYPMRVMRILSKYLTGNEIFYEDEFEDEIEVIESEETDAGLEVG
ncbi:translation initiation inhibitor [Paenibacillus antibioticophila]|uniref:Translation initiation inhibitor n=1 Tax=Paenibacillus antibioticophila TaxID=1274374 RepID=A0A919XTC8_9BACL|nr:DUF3962 domain-containing protein [Paenibacillus antibioticophila]GIO36555.1 translation initiation inhibitor [Paenibacillus antibioticophila]